MFRRLEALHADGHRFVAFSEERGRVDFGGGPVRVVIDPLDGSKNAKRGLPHHALSLAVADGATMADVVLRLRARLRRRARSGSRAAARARSLNGAPLDPGVPERRVGGKLELLGIESADPRWVRDSADELAETAHRLRAIGAIAVTLCQVAAARLDGMVTLRRSRAVDVAAGQLIVREAGGVVAFTACADPLGAPLDEPAAGRRRWSPRARRTRRRASWRASRAAEPRSRSACHPLPDGRLEPRRQGGRRRRRPAARRGPRAVPGARAARRTRPRRSSPATPG